MANFVRAANPIWFFVDLVGQPLNDTYYISMLRNVFPYLPQNVFHDNQGLIPWSDPIQFLPNGTLPDNIYWPDDEVWRLEIRQGPLSTDPLIYVINDFDPGNSGASPPDTVGGTMDNQITNPQFAYVNFPTTITSPSSTTPTLTLTTAGTYNIASGWQLVLTGTGSVTISQLIFSGSQNSLNAPVPPYSLRINSSGWSSVILQQKLSGVGSIWYNNYISMSVVARSETAANNLTLGYAPNSPGTPVTIGQGILTTGNSYETIQGIVPLGVPPSAASTNTTLNNAAFVNIQITIPPNGITDISDIQVMGQATALPVNFSATPDETLERQLDHQFNVYANDLIIKPKNSILVGWNFALNPWSFNVTGSGPISISAQCSYIADQTILYQNAASQVQFGQVSATVPWRSLYVQSATSASDNRFALIQYIDPNSIMPYWNAILSSLVRAYLSTSHSTKVRIKMRLIYRNTLPSSIGNAEPIASWAANSDPVFSAGWTAIAPAIDTAYILPTSTLGNGEIPAMAFNQFQMPPQAALAQTLGIVVYTMDQMNNTGGSADFVVWDKISLVPNRFAVETHPQTSDQCLRECQYYYEKSYQYGDVAGTANDGVNQLYSEQLAIQSGSSLTVQPRGFNIIYSTPKRSQATTILYSPVSGTAGNVRATLYDGGGLVTSNDATLASFWTAATPGQKSIFYNATNAASIVSGTHGPNFPEGFITYHFTADARLGI